MSVAALHADIRAAFRAKILATAGLPVAFHWEGMAFTAQIGTPFLRERIMPVGSNPRGLGVGGAIAHRTLCLAMLYYPSGKGTLAIETAAGVLLEAFAPATALLHGVAKATITSVERGEIQHEPDWASCTIQVSTLAYTAI